MGDIDEIQQVKYRYLRALDTKHWDEFADTLTEDVVGDYDAVRSARSTTSPTATPSSSSCATSMPANIITEHRVTHPEIAVDGDEATAIWYLQDRVIVPDFNFMLIGAAFYHDQYRRTSDGWKISRTGYERTYDATMSTENHQLQVKAGRALNI